MLSQMIKAERITEFEFIVPIEEFPNLNVGEDTVDVKLVQEIYDNMRKCLETCPSNLKKILKLFFIKEYIC